MGLEKLKKYKILEEHFENEELKDIFHCKLEAKTPEEMESCGKNILKDDIYSFYEQEAILRINGEGRCVGKSELFTMFFPKIAEQLEELSGGDENLQENVGTYGLTPKNNKKSLLIFIKRPHSKKFDCIRKFRMGYREKDYNEMTDESLDRITEKIEEEIKEEMEIVPNFLKMVKERPNYIILLNENEE